MSVWNIIVAPYLSIAGLLAIIVVCAFVGWLRRAKRLSLAPAAGASMVAAIVVEAARTLASQTSQMGVLTAILQLPLGHLLTYLVIGLGVYAPLQTIINRTQERRVFSRK